jgi:alkanesulfonate monooxygenase SsuD/methylene tetrahydromethanopterin reductase-like flavin-dependent oxidoreductase (luciferase family)
MNVAPFNIPWDRRARRLAETVKVLRMLWTGEPTDFEGEFYKLDQAFLQALPSRDEGVPIYIAANSPFTRKIAGRLGDGWISEMLSPELYKRDLGEVLRAAEKADSGRNIDVVYHVFGAVSEDREAAKANANGLVKMQFTWWPKQLERYGFKISDRCDWNRIVIDDESFRESVELSKEVPEEVADLVTISGNVDECIGQIEDYVEAGVTHFAFSIPGSWDETLESLGKTVIPYFKEIHS